MSELRFFNPYAAIRHTENRLPHWQQEAAVYFVTFRLADSLPSRLLNQWQDERGPLEKLIRSWKGFTARQINKLLGRSGGFWQRDYFDRLIRDEKHFGNCVRYIRRNPEKTRLNAGEFVLWESELAREIC